MTTTTAGGFCCGITYGENHWLAWTYPSDNPEGFRAHSGQTRELAIKRAQERTSAAVGDALRGISTDGVWIAKGFTEPPTRPVKAIPKMCVPKDTRPKTEPKPKPLPVGTPRGPAARSLELPVGEVFACYTVVRYVRPNYCTDGRANPVYLVRCAKCQGTVELHRKSLFGARYAKIDCCRECRRKAGWVKDG